MSDFVNFEKAQSLCAIMSDASNKLCDRKIVKGKHGSTAHTTFDPSIKATFELLVENGYGKNQIGDKNPADQAKLNSFSAILSNGKRDPGSITTALSSFDGLTLSQFFYTMNKRSMRDDRYLVDVVDSKCLLKILERAMQLGKHQGPG